MTDTPTPLTWRHEGEVTTETLDAWMAAAPEGAIGVTGTGTEYTWLFPPDPAELVRLLRSYLVKTNDGGWSLNMLAQQLVEDGWVTKAPT